MDFAKSLWLFGNETLTAMLDHVTSFGQDPEIVGDPECDFMRLEANAVRADLEHELNTVRGAALIVSHEGKLACGD